MCSQAYNEKQQTNKRNKQKHEIAQIKYPGITIGWLELC